MAADYPRIGIWTGRPVFLRHSSRKASVEESRTAFTTRFDLNEGTEAAFRIDHGHDIILCPRYDRPEASTRPHRLADIMFDRACEDVHRDRLYTRLLSCCPMFRHTSRREEA